MFTVRVQRADVSHTLTCAQYTVERRGDQQVLTLYAGEGPLQGQSPILTTALEDDTRVFVMNDNGNTVDTVRKAFRR